MRKSVRALSLIAALLCLAAVLNALPSEIDGSLMARRRLFSTIGPGLRQVRHGANGNYYVLASPSVGLAIFDAKFKQMSVLGAPPNSDTLKTSTPPVFGFGEDCDVDYQGNIYIADRSNNQVIAFSPDGRKLRSFPIEGQPVSIAALPDGEVAVTTLQRTHLVTVYGSSGKVTREFGNLETLSTRPDIDRIINYGRVASDPEGHVYFGFTYLPEPLVRQYDRFGYGGQAFEFTGVDAYPEAQATRKEIERFESNNKPAALRPILTAFGVDPVNGDVWMGLHNTLVHFDKEGNRRSEYLVYTSKGARLEASVIVVQEETLLIGSDPLGVYEFLRPDRLR
jgi:hypothetical protein